MSSHAIVLHFTITISGPILKLLMMRILKDKAKQRNDQGSIVNNCALKHGVTLKA